MASCSPTLEHAVFTYGTLMHPPVLVAVISRVPETIKATLPSHVRRPLLDACYPVVLRSPSDSVHGRLLTDITGKELSMLDKFEDPAYERAIETVVDETGKHWQARVWRRLDTNGVDLNGQWSFDQFKAEYGALYVEKCQEWAAIPKPPDQVLSNTEQ